jgi:hypothetical protein
MSLLDCHIDWHAPASLKNMETPANRTFAWVGDHVHYGTVAGAIRKFATLSPQEQRHVEMFTDAGVVGGLHATIFSFDALSQIASRSDVPTAQDG